MLQVVFLCHPKSVSTNAGSPSWFDSHIGYKSSFGQLLTSNELVYGSAPLGFIDGRLESVQRAAGAYLASPNGRVGQRLLREGEVILRSIAGNINVSAKLIDNIKLGAKWGGNALGAIGVGLTIERLANDPTYHLWNEGGADLVLVQQDLYKFMDGQFPVPTL